MSQNGVMSDAFDSFFSSLDRDEPPGSANAMLRAVWHGLRGEWDAAHELAQAQDDAEGAWVHAWLHRVEGDLGNAAYWYGQARRPVASQALETEWDGIVTALLGSQSAA